MTNQNLHGVCDSINVSETLYTEERIKEERM